MGHGVMKISDALRLIAAEDSQVIWRSTLLKAAQSLDDMQAENAALKNKAYDKQEEDKMIAAIVADTKAGKQREILIAPETGIGDLSDGYHTFNELYHHRAILFSVICHFLPDYAWKSKLHHDGTMFEGMFIVGMEFIQGEQITYHYQIDPYWDYFKVKELEKAPEWDGHTPSQAAERLEKIGMVCLVASEDSGRRKRRNRPKSVI